MIAVDSNVLLRFIMQDDPRQASIATRVVETELNPENPGFVSLPVLSEVVWTLTTTYGLADGEARRAISEMIDVPQLVIADEEVVRAALASSASLVDALIHELGRAAGCAETVTFDRRFARLSGVRLLDG